MDFNVLGDDDHSYQIQSGSGEPFLVAKNGLSPDLQAMIEAKKPQPQAPAPSEADAIQAEQVNFLSQPGLGDRAGITPEVPKEQINQEASQRTQSILDQNQKAQAARQASLLRAQAVDQDQGGALPPGMQPSTNNQLAASTLNPLSSASDSSSQPKLTPGQLPDSKPEAGRVSLSQLATPAVQVGGNQGLPGQDRISGIQGGYGLQAQGIKNEAEAGAKRAAEVSGYYNQFQDDLQKRQLEIDQRNRDQQAQVQDQMDKFVKYRDEYQNSTVDPKRFWNNLSTGGKVLASFSIFLGGLGNAMQGKGGNGAMEVINNAIDRDLQSQKIEADKKHSLVSDQQNLVQMMRSQFSDRAQADAAARAAMYDSAGLKLKEITSKYEGPELQAKTQQLLGQLAVQKNQAMMQFEQAARQNAALMGFSSGGPGQGVGLQGRIQNPLALGEKLSENAVSMPNGGYELAASKSAAEKTNHFTEKYKEVIDVLDRLDGLKGRALPGTTEAKLAEQNIAALKPLLNEINGISRFTEQDEKAVLDPQIGNPTAFLQGRNLALLSNLKDIMQKKANSVYSTNVIGFKPVQFKPNK